VKVDPFAPQLLIDYDLFCRKHGHTDFGDYMARWYAATALIEAAEAAGEDPFAITVEDLEAALPPTPDVN
jgi:hypothetical protein